MYALYNSSIECKLYDLLNCLSEKLDEKNESITKINVTRANPMDGVRRALRRTSFNPSAKFSVRFADDFGVYEGAIDEGGPTRELVRLLFRHISELPVFRGLEATGKGIMLDVSGTY